MFKRIFHLFLCAFFTIHVCGDNFYYNTFNNHGVLGLINMPTARIYEEGSVGVTVYDGTPDQKITVTSSPYDWLEASFFYTNIQGKPYPGFEYQDYKDKGFNLKLKIKEEGIFPAIAIGINDIAGTGFYSAEYIVASYGINNLDFHFGVGWGNLNKDDSKFKNPLVYISDKFESRPLQYEDQGGQFQLSRYFSDKNISPYFGFSYAINPKILIKLERDTTNTNSRISFDEPKSEFSLGMDYIINKNFVSGLSFERNNYISLRFTYKIDASKSEDSSGYGGFKSIEKIPNQDEYTSFIRSIENNGIGVNKLVESADFIGLELTQYMHPNLDIVEDIIYSAKIDSGVAKDLKVDYRIADLQAFSNFDEKEDKNIVYAREKKPNFSSRNRLNIRPFLAAREGFFRYSIFAENNTQWVMKDNFHFTSNIKYSIKDNFDDLVIPPEDVYPKQVRSDIKDYLREYDNGVIIGRAQFDYYKTLSKNNHIMLTAGVLEDMYSGYGFEYLNFNSKNNYAYGFEIFNVKKRDYKMRFGTLDFQTTSAFANFYYRNSFMVPFDMKISHGKYLAGDIGTTIELMRTFKNGTQLGVFASFTDVSSEDFGEGSFDKGIFFNIPIYRNFVNYSWRPLTKDPGAKLIRMNTLHDLLIRFKPFNEQN